ncbi:MAG: VPLPA-CTERM sorting domain-containing protein [Candidatus Moranbacteria bacterium]|nr:VPLPA-CTERM sorting domain-containing protein [Candidatus Moranbacteria bacterium]
MKRVIVGLGCLLAVVFFAGQAVASTVIDFNDGSLELPMVVDGYLILSPLDAPEDRIVYDPATGEGYLEAGFWVGVERLDGNAFVLGGFDGRSPSGTIAVWTEEHQVAFAVGTDSFQPAVAPTEGWDPNESFFSLSFWAGDVDNLELREKILIPKPPIDRTSAVPLPGAVWLLGAGISVLLATNRRRK